MKPGHLSVSMQGKAVSGSLQAMPATMTTNTLTPTTLKTITQIFESDACLDNLERYGESGGFQPPTVLPNAPQYTDTDGAILTLTPASVASSSPGLAVVTTTSRHWQGGSVTTVVAPNKTKNPLALAEEEEEDEEYHDDARDEDYEPDVKRHAAAVARRSSSRMAAKVVTFSPVVSSSSTGEKRKVRSGRKPAGGRAIDEESLTPAEFKKLNVRRERNKLAAARCRNRRMDITNNLAGEVEVWEDKKKSLTQEIQELTAAKQELEFVLEAHRHTCNFSAATQAAQPVMVAIKSEPVPVTAAASPVLVEPVNPVYIMESYVAAAAKPRPSSLSFARQQPKAVSPKVEGVDIETPSVILPNICFDSLGLTPTTVVFNSIMTPVAPPMLNTPTCSRQHYAQSGKAGDAGVPEYLQL